MFRKENIKSQSILEYLIVLGAIIVTILVATGLFQKGLQNDLNATQKEMEKNLKGNEPPQQVRNANYYVESRTHFNSEWTNNIDTYGGPVYNQYYFHEGEADTSHIPADGTILDYDYSFVAPEPQNIQTSSGNYENYINEYE